MQARMRGAIILAGATGLRLAGQPRRLPLHVSDLFGEEVVEGFYGGEFVFFDVEYSVELGDMEDVLNFFGEAEEFEVAAGVTDGGIATD